MAVILIVDDEQGLRDLMCRILEGVGHTVIKAADGGRGLILFRQHAPDLVISDIIMPKQTGVELVARLRAEAPTTPIVVISGGGRARMMDLLEVAKNAGANLVLPKPFRKDEFLAAIDQFVPRPSANEEGKTS